MANDQTSQTNQNDPAAEARNRVIAENNEAKARSLSEFSERTKGKPTPTQDENDRATLGEHVINKEHDGSVRQHPANEPPRQRTSEPMSTTRGGYDTRQAQPQQSGQRQPSDQGSQNKTG
jgi:hypothetical protein